MLLRVLSCLSVLATLAIGQTVHQVGPGGFATVGAALAVAAPGDFVIVAPGSYPAFQATVGVTVRAATPRSVTIGTGTSVHCPGQTMVLVDLDFVFASVTGGTCVFDGCRVVAAAGVGGPCLSVANATARLMRSTVGQPGNPPQIPVGGPAPALRATAATVSAVDCTIRGRDRDSFGILGGGAGIQLDGSTFHGAHLLVEGGAGISGSIPPGAAVSAVNSTFWIADSTLLAGLFPNPLATMRGLCAVVGSSGQLARCTFEPVTCPPTVPTSAPLVSARLPAVPQSGQPFTVDVRGEPNRIVLVGLGFGQGTTTLPAVVQPVGLDLGLVITLGFLVTDAAGAASGTWPLGPGTSNLPLWIQVAGLTTPAIQLSPVTGGALR